MSALHVFDMDGTLLRDTSASLELARHIGALSEVDELERISAAGQLSNVEFHRRTHALWQGLTQEQIETAFAAAPWIGNLGAVWDDIAKRGETAIVISMSPLFFVERLSRWGAQRVFASDNPIGAPIEESNILEDYHKVAIVEELVRTGGYSRDRIVAYGDSYTDVPLFMTGVRSVAVNASETVEKLASKRYRGDDLQLAYELGRGLL